MKLELTLVEKDSPFNFTTGKFISRKRASVEDFTQFTNEFKSFLSENADTISEYLSDETYLTLLQSKELSVSDVYSIKSVLKESFLDVEFLAVSEDEINELFVTEETIEVCIIDNRSMMLDCIPLTTKIIVKPDFLMSEVFTAQLAYLEEGGDEELIAPIKLAIESNLIVLGDLEVKGEISSSLTFIITDQLKSLGINLKVITA